MGHPTRESLHYALGLLDTWEEGQVYDTACSILRRVLPLQVRDIMVSTHGKSRVKSCFSKLWGQIKFWVVSAPPRKHDPYGLDLAAASAASATDSHSLTP